MGNISLGAGRKTAKVMTINGETIKFKTPVRAESVLEGHTPGHVLLEAEAVKHYGVRAKPLEPHQELKPKRLYFLVCRYDDDAKLQPGRRVHSGIQMTAKDRLESLMLARRSASDLCIMKPPSISLEENRKMFISGGSGGGIRMTMRLPKAEVERLMAETKDKAQMAEKIVNLYIQSRTHTPPIRDNAAPVIAGPQPKPRQVIFFWYIISIIQVCQHSLALI